MEYYSRFPVFRRLHRRTAKYVTSHMQVIFSDMVGLIPYPLTRGPCYTTIAFRQAMDAMGIHHISSSPHYHMSNGLAEKCVQIVKSLLCRSKKSGEEPNPALILYISTPIGHDLPSPIESLSAT